MRYDISWHWRNADGSLHNDYRRGLLLSELVSLLAKQDVQAKEMGATVLEISVTTR